MRGNPLFLLVCLVLLLCTALPLYAQDAAPLTAAEAQSVLGQYTAAWAAGDLDALLGLVTEDIVWDVIDPTGLFWGNMQESGSDTFTALVRREIIQHKRGQVQVDSVEDDTAFTSEVWQSDELSQHGMVILVKGEVTFRGGRIARYASTWTPATVSEFERTLVMKEIAASFVQALKNRQIDAVAFYLAEDVSIELSFNPIQPELLAGEGKAEIKAIFQRFFDNKVVFTGDLTGIVNDVATVAGRLNWSAGRKLMGAPLPCSLLFTFRDRKVAQIELRVEREVLSTYKAALERTVAEEVAPTEAEAAPTVGGLVTLRFTSEALRGNLIGDPISRRLEVYLPAGYDAGTQRYPVVYALHGYGQPSQEYAGNQSGQLDVMIANGTIPPMIWVFPDADNRFWGSQYRSSKTIGDYEGYITHEIVETVDSTFRTLPAAESRAVTGCSMGGDGAIHFALRYPNVFGVAVPMSAAYDFADEKAVKPALTYLTLDAGGTLPTTWPELERLARAHEGSGWIMSWYALAGGVTPNPELPELFVNPPFVFGANGPEIPIEVMEQITAADAMHEVYAYLEQPVRLQALMLMHGTSDGFVTSERVRAFDVLLTELGVEHEYLEFAESHCGFPYDPGIVFMAENLVFEEP